MLISGDLDYKPILAFDEQMGRRGKTAKAMKFMSHVNKPTHKLRQAPQPPLSHAGAPAEADRAKSPPLSQASRSGRELNPGDRVMGLAAFGKPTGEFGTVEKTNEEDAVVKWDDDGRTRQHQPSLKKV